MHERLLTPEEAALLFQRYTRSGEPNRRWALRVLPRVQVSPRVIRHRESDLRRLIQGGMR